MEQASTTELGYLLSDLPDSRLGSVVAKVAIHSAGIDASCYDARLSERCRMDPEMLTSTLICCVPARRTRCTKPAAETIEAGLK